MHGCRAAPTARASAGSTASGACACSLPCVPLRVHAGETTAATSTTEATLKTKLKLSNEAGRRLPWGGAPSVAEVVPLSIMGRHEPPRGTLFDREIRAAGDSRARDRAGLHLVLREDDVRGQLRHVHLARLTRRRNGRDGAAPREPCKRSHKHASCNESPHRIIPFVKRLEHPYR